MMSDGGRAGRKDGWEGSWVIEGGKACWMGGWAGGWLSGRMDKGEGGREVGRGWMSGWVKGWMTEGCSFC